VEGAVEHELFHVHLGYLRENSLELLWMNAKELFNADRDAISFQTEEGCMKRSFLIID